MLAWQADWLGRSCRSSLRKERELDNGLVISKKRVAMGVIGIIYESRPNDTSNAAGSGSKSGNAQSFSSGKDAYQTAPAIVTAHRKTDGSDQILAGVSGYNASRASRASHDEGQGLSGFHSRGGAGLIQ